MGRGPPEEHPIKAGLYRHIAEQARELNHIRELAPCMDAVAQLETVDAASVRSINLGIGVAEAELTLPRSLFYSTLSEQSGLTVADDGDLLELLTGAGAGARGIRKSGGRAALRAGERLRHRDAERGRS